MNAVFVFHFFGWAVDCVAVKQPLEGCSINEKNKLLENHCVYKLQIHTVGMLTEKNAFFFLLLKTAFFRFICHSKSSENEASGGGNVWLSHESPQYLICLRINSKAKGFLVEMSNDKFDAFFFCLDSHFKGFTWNSYVGTKPLFFTLVLTNIQKLKRILETKKTGQMQCIITFRSVEWMHIHMQPLCVSFSKVIFR